MDNEQIKMLIAGLQELLAEQAEAIAGLQELLAEVQS